MIFPSRLCRCQCHYLLDPAYVEQCTDQVPDSYLALILRIWFPIDRFHGDIVRSTPSVSTDLARLETNYLLRNHYCHGRPKLTFSICSDLLTWCDIGFFTTYN